MAQVARKDDISDHGLAPIGAPDIESSVKVNGKEIAIYGGTMKGVYLSCGLWQEGPTGAFNDDVHPLGRNPLQGGFGIPGPAEGSNTVYAGGKPVHRFHDRRGCGAETITASPNVFADGDARIRIPGATVTNQVSSLAAPLGFSYEYPEIYMLVGDNNFYIRTATDIHFSQLKQEHFLPVGTMLVPSIKFNSNLSEFDVPDIDLASKDNIPTTQFNSNSNTFVGLNINQIPSYGQGTNIDTLGIITGIPTDVTWTDFYDFEGNDKFFAGYRISISNESGTAETYLKLIIMPDYPFYFIN